ncbi:MAG: hypothetical protein E4G74_01895 [Erysipelotrichales bacterium]|nr:MAG: hypothetical protein E4G74_01895 [Erysipelotrichales bacterium]
MLKKMLVTLLIGILLFSGCTYQRPISANITHSRTWSSDSAYYGKGITFELVDSEFFDASKQVFWIHSEEELALLLTIQFDKGVRVVEYMSENPLDAERVISYLVSLFVHDFEYYDGLFEYSDGGVVKLVSDYVQLESIEPDIVYVENEIDEWTKNIKDEDLEPQIEAKYFHDLIIKEVRYDETAGKDDNRETDAYSAIGVFEDRLAVCNGYSQAYMGLLKEMEIPAILISSNVDDHAWNMVYIANEWKYVDTTWDDLDDKIERPIYDYFLKSEDEFTDHIFDKSGYMTLSQTEYMEFANFVFPQLQSSSTNQ